MGKVLRGSGKSRKLYSASALFSGIFNGNEKSYGHLETIIDALPDSLFVFDIDRRLVWWNKKVEILSKLSPAELKSKYILDFFDEKNHVYILEAFQRTLTDGECEIEVEVAAESGPIPFMFRAIVLKDPDEKIIGIAGVGRDITAKVKAAASLRVSENRFREMLENVHLLAIILDVHGSIRFCNDYLLKISGYTREEVLGKNWFDLFLSEPKRARFQEKFSKDLRSKILASHQEYEIVCRNGDKKMVSWNSTTLREADGTISGEACIGVDITDQLNSILELKNSEERYRAVVQQASEGIMLIDPDSRKILGSNPAICKLLGYEPSELTKLNLYDIVALDREIIDRNITRILTENLSFLGRRRYRAKEGHLIDAEVNVALVTYGGKKVFCAMVRDITERLKAEEELRKAREMETLGSLVSGVAHEVRSPLFVISTSAETLFKKVGNLPEVKAILDQVERLSRLMKDLLTLKPSSLPEKMPNDFHDLIKITVTHLEASYVGCGERIQIITTAESPKILGDRDQLIQVFYNLLLNSLQHSTRADGLITVQAEYSKGGVLSHVRDHGPGIPTEHHQRVFEPFVTMRKGGVGLGLHIARRIVENHSGKIQVVNNNPGPGCCFEIFLPGMLEKAE
jgi:two-component system sporulation sensor kinase A